jgi:hypothetical protein
MTARRLAIIVAFLIVALAAIGQTIVDANAVQIAWDAVTTLDNGDPIPAGDIIAYEILVAPSGDKGAAISQGEVTNTQTTVQLATEGVFVIGVRTIRVVNGTRYESPINWSDVNGVNTPDPFLVRLYRPPAVPAGLRVQ